MTSVVVHYGELALKGRNRPWFITTLVKTIRHALADLDVLGEVHLAHAAFADQLDDAVAIVDDAADHVAGRGLDP